MDERHSIKDMMPEHQPRERLKEFGARALSNAELLAILLRTGLPGKNVVKVAQEMLDASDGSLHTLSIKSLPQLMEIEGVGETKAITISAVMELGHRLAIERTTRKIEKIEESNDVYAALIKELGRLQHEEFWALYMDTHKNVIHKCRIHSGGISATIVDLRLIFKTALAYNATSFAVAHNHPSGSIQPSKDDNSLTKRLVEAGRTMAIPLFDHIIIGEAKSYASEGVRIAKSGVDYYSYHDTYELATM